MWFWVSTLPKTNTLGRACRINKCLLTGFTLLIYPSNFFRISFSRSSPPHACLLQSPIHASDVPSKVLGGELLIPSSKPRPARKGVESAECSPGVAYSSNRTSDWESIQRTGSETMFKTSHWNAYLRRTLLGSAAFTFGISSHLALSMEYLERCCSYIWSSKNFFYFYNLGFFVCLFTRNVCS